MFTELVTVVFPYLGECFGLLAFFANCTVREFLSFMFPDQLPLTIQFLNVFTGELSTFTNHNSAIVSIIGAPIKEAIINFTGPYADSPVWLAILLLSCSLLLVFYVYKFITR